MNKKSARENIYPIQKHLNMFNSEVSISGYLRSCSIEMPFQTKPFDTLNRTAFDHYWLLRFSMLGHWPYKSQRSIWNWAICLKHLTLDERRWQIWELSFLILFLPLSSNHLFLLTFRRLEVWNVRHWMGKLNSFS